MHCLRMLCTSILCVTLRNNVVCYHTQNMFEYICSISIIKAFPTNHELKHKMYALFKMFRSIFLPYFRLIFLHVKFMEFLVDFQGNVFFLLQGVRANKNNLKFEQNVFLIARIFKTRLVSNEVEMKWPDLT